MPWWGNLIAAVVILVGLTGIIVPILPGVVLIFGAILAWAIVEGSAAAWAVFGVATIFLIVSGIIKYTWPGKNLKEAQVPNRSLFWGGVLAIAGFFLIPLVGIFAGFVAGVYLSERQRLGSHEKAWPSTVHALKAVGLSIIIELLGGLIASGIWVVAIFAV